jgi:3-dehydroquinate synthase
MQTFKVRSKHFTYPVVIGRGAWQTLRGTDSARYTSIFVLTEKSLWRRWGALFLKESGLGAVATLFVPSGEASKSIHVLERLAGQLLQRGADRRSCLILFGGGVIGDLGAFLASVYMRGIDCVHVPTTILAQVDSAIGGKTAVNLGQMKNLIGSFHPGRMVLSDPRVLSSLSPRNFRSGLYEVVKHAVLKGTTLFRQLEGSVDSLHPGHIEGLEPILPAAVKVKVDVVNRDEQEADLRLVLNLGHTFGHALEEATGYRRFVHGEAVGWGLLGVVCLGQHLGVLAPAEGARISALIRRVGPLPPIRDISQAKILGLLPQDKKTVGGKIHWVIPERIGKARIMKDVPPSAVSASLRDIQRMDHREFAQGSR